MDISVGQIWSFKTDKFNANSVIIHYIETLPNGFTAVHVTIDKDVPINDAESMSLGHFPFEITALRNSLNEFLGITEEGRGIFEEGYKYWKEAQGGIFTLSVDEAIGVVIETNLNPDRALSE